MVAASCALINRAGFQTDLMVQEDGGYGFMDFAKVGVPFTNISPLRRGCKRSKLGPDDDSRARFGVGHDEAKLAAQALGVARDEFAVLVHECEQNGRRPESRRDVIEHAQPLFGLPFHGRHAHTDPEPGERADEPPRYEVQDRDTAPGEAPEHAEVVRRRGEWREASRARAVAPTR